MELPFIYSRPIPFFFRFLLELIQRKNFFFFIFNGEGYYVAGWKIDLLYSTVKYVLDHHLYNMQSVKSLHAPMHSPHFPFHPLSIGRKEKLILYYSS